jgi:gamma-glutamyl-gamma-aminobutyrate hydrolase PuuD
VLFLGRPQNTDPSYFGDFTISLTSNNPHRDKWEYALGKKLLFDSKMPVLGICRGIQSSRRRGRDALSDASKCGDFSHV